METRLIRIFLAATFQMFAQNWETMEKWKQKGVWIFTPLIAVVKFPRFVSVVVLQDYADTELLLSRANVDQAALLSYAREAADFSTNHQLPTLDFAINHYGQPDVAMFDFTCMYASENAAMVRQRNGHKLLVALVGDSLLEVRTDCFLIVQLQL